MAVDDKSIVTLHAFCAGASHTRDALQCEDYAISFNEGDMSIAVVSDGHSDPSCFRSARGAKFACEAAIEVLKEFLGRSDGVFSKIDDTGKTLRRLEQSILTSWLERVRADVRTGSFAADAQAYGCTLIAVLCAKTYWLGLQIGDGRCVAIYENGLYSQPIPWDHERCVGNYTASMCDEAAIEEFRHYHGTEIPAALFAASDGLDTSFDEQGLYNCYYTIACWMRDMSPEESVKNVERLLPKISDRGSGDDMAISAIVRTERYISRPIEKLTNGE
jgi:hypothetical protein